ncbi:hypothetical protein pb186bvf_004415 [Paramecium bursaria]
MSQMKKSFKFIYHELIVNHNKLYEFQIIFIFLY